MLFFFLQLGCVQEITLGFNQLAITNRFNTIYSACIVIKIGLIIKKDSGWPVSFVSQYFRKFHYSLKAVYCVELIYN